MPITIGDLSPFLKMGGADDVEEALTNWQAERAAMVELRKENINLCKVQIGLWEIIDLMVKAFAVISEDVGAMFLPPKVVSLIQLVMLKVDAAKKLADELKVKSS